MGTTVINKPPVIVKRNQYGLLENKNINYVIFRDLLYDILTYNLDVAECIWYIIYNLIQNNHIKQENITKILIKTYTFFKFFNNNYRPIYHLESIIFYIIGKINQYEL